MNKEQRFFLTCIADHLGKRNTTVPENLDWGKVLLYAEQQQVEGVIGYQINHPDLQSKSASSMYYAANRQKELKRIHEEFKKRNIPYLIFKGTEIAQYYPISMFRTMGDIDILVHFEDKERAAEALTNLGFCCESCFDYEWPFYKGCVEIELHHEIADSGWAIEKEQKSFCDLAWNYAYSKDGIEFHLEQEYHLVYMLIHIKKHFMNNGVGFRQFIDLAVVAKQKLDWDKVRKYLTESEMQPYSQTCLTLMERWFGVQTVLHKEIAEDFYEEASQQIFANGVFGFDNSDNRINKIVNQVRGGKRKSVVLLRKLFPSYTYLSNEKPFSFVRGKRYLVPVAWMYRFIYDIKNGYVKLGLKTAVSPFFNSTALKKREMYLKQWGL